MWSDGNPHKATSPECGVSSCPFFSSVVYEGCPRAFDAGIWWPKTKFGLPAAMDCPRGSIGASFFFSYFQFFEKTFFVGLRLSGVLNETLIHLLRCTYT